MEGGADYDDSYMGGDQARYGGTGGGPASGGGSSGTGGGSRSRAPAAADLDDEIPF
jgi:hypothetical protein